MDYQKPDLLTSLKNMERAKFYLYNIKTFLTDLRSKLTPPDLLKFLKINMERVKFYLYNIKTFLTDLRSKLIKTNISFPRRSLQLKTKRLRRKLLRYSSKLINQIETFTGYKWYQFQDALMLTSLFLLFFRILLYSLDYASVIFNISFMIVGWLIVLKFELSDKFRENITIPLLKWGIGYNFYRHDIYGAIPEEEIDRLEDVKLPEKIRRYVCRKWLFFSVGLRLVIIKYPFSFFFLHYLLFITFIINKLPIFTFIWIFLLTTSRLAFLVTDYRETNLIYNFMLLLKMDIRKIRVNKNNIKILTFFVIRSLEDIFYHEYIFETQEYKTNSYIKERAGVYNFNPILSVGTVSFASYFSDFRYFQPFAKNQWAFQAFTKGTKNHYFLVDMEDCGKFTKIRMFVCYSNKDNKELPHRLGYPMLTHKKPTEATNVSTLGLEFDATGKFEDHVNYFKQLQVVSEKKNPTFIQSILQLKQSNTFSFDQVIAKQGLNVNLSELYITKEQATFVSALLDFYVQERIPFYKEDVYRFLGSLQSDSNKALTSLSDYINFSLPKLQNAKNYSHIYKEAHVLQNNLRNQISMSDVLTIAKNASSQGAVIKPPELP